MTLTVPAPRMPQLTALRFTVPAPRMPQLAALRFTAVLLLAASLPGAVRSQCAVGERVVGAGCEACPEGKASGGNSAVCTPCTAGTYASGAATCAACPAGYVCPLAVPGDASGGTDRNQCPSGTASGGEGQSTCITCTAGKSAQAGSPYVPPVTEACIMFCIAGYTAGNVDNPSTTCPAGCTLTPAAAARDAEAATCTGTPTDDSYDCAGLFAAAGGTAEADCITGDGAGCTYTAAVEAAGPSNEVCAAASTADCSTGFTPGNAASCPNEGSPTGCTYIAAAAAVPAEPGASSCSDCPVGRSVAEAAAEVCAACDAGQYSLQVSATCSGAATDPTKSCVAVFSVASSDSESDCTTGDGAGCTYTPSRGATECLTCEAGYMCPGDTGRSECAEGSYSDAGASTCEECAVGKYGTTSADSVRLCVDCTPGRFTSIKAQLACLECPQAHRCPGGTQQRGCSGGTYQPDPGQASCITCPAGQMAASVSTQCDPCPRGRYSRVSSPTCKTCPGGYMCEGNTDKVACGAGQYSVGRYPASYTPDDTSDEYTTSYEDATNIAGPSMCQSCSAGTYTQEVAFRRAWTSFPAEWVCASCDPGYECLRGSDKRICPAGKYAPGSSSACLDCPTGQYSSEGAAACTTCDAGTYCPGKLLTQALRCCPGGTSVTPSCPEAARSYPTEAGGGTVGICTRELPGGTCDSGITTETCNGFGTGTCSSVCQRVSSLLCVKGTFSESGRTSCENCAPGQYSYANNASCMPCTPGSFCAGGPVSEVAPHVDDPAFDDASLQLNIYHAMPRFAPGDALTSRQKCPNGTWSNDDRLVEAGGDPSVLAWCANCTSGMFSQMGATSCTNCTAGKYSLSGWPVCQNCSRSTYCPGGTGEVQCPSGFFSEVGATECTGCPAGKYAQPGAEFCSDCDQGFWCPGSTDRVACGAGTWANGTGASSVDACEACGVAPACLAGGRCREGHRNDFCLDCVVDPSPWYKVDDLCVPCPTNTTLIMAVAGSMFLVFAIIMLRMGSAGKKRQKGAVGNKVTVPFSILFTNLQIVMKFYELNLRWPQFVLDFIEQLGTVLELDFVALSMADPACSFQFENPGEGYKFRQNLVALMLPAFCLCIAFLHLMSSCVMSSLAMSGNRMQAYLYLIRGVPGEVANACVTAFSTMYMGIVASSLEAWHCTRRVKPELHMDQHPNIMCSFADPGSTGSYFSIFSTGLLMFIIYGIGFPMFMLISLYTRNKRWVPLDKANYVDPPNPFVSCCKYCTTRSKHCCVKTLMSPIFFLAWAFQDRETARLVKEEEESLKAKKEYDEKMEMQLETRMKGGGSARDEQHWQHHSLPDTDRSNSQAQPGAGRRVLRVPAAYAASTPSDSSVVTLAEEWRLVDDEPLDEGQDREDEESSGSELLLLSLDRGLSLTERLQGGKKAKQAAIKAAREAEAAYKADSDEEEKAVKKKKVKKKPKKTTGALNSYSYKDSIPPTDSGGSNKSTPMVRSKSTRKLRSDLTGPTSHLKAASFADLHHAKVTEVKKKERAGGKRANVISTKSWLEQAAEGETEVAKSFKERKKAQSLKESSGGGGGKVNLKSESFQKRMAGIKSGLPANGGGSFKSAGSAGGSFKDGKVAPESAAARRAAAKLKDASFKGGFFGRKPPEYEVDEEETDGYIYWHDGTRKTLGWVYLRFRPERWYFEFVYMMRKVAVLAVTTYLGNVGEGHVAWGVITLITSVAFAGQWFLTPFPEDRATRYSKTLCPCCADLCSPHHGLFKYPVRVMMSYMNPSLNDLELAGLTCQLVTLVCGLGCLVWGRAGSIDSGDTAEQINFILGVISLSAMLLFVGIVVIFWQKAVWNVIVIKWRGSDDDDLDADGTSSHLRSGSSRKQLKGKGQRGRVAGIEEEEVVEGVVIEEEDLAASNGSDNADADEEEDGGGEDDEDDDEAQGQKEKQAPAGKKGAAKQKKEAGAAGKKRKKKK